MRAVVVELKNSHAAILTDDGSIIPIHNKNYEVGQVINYKPAAKNLYKKIGVFAASAAAFVFLSIGTWAYASPYSYVSLDVNPSIEFSINHFDRVLHVNAINEEGAVITDQLSIKKLKNKKIEGAIAVTVEQISEAGYFDNNPEGGIIIAASSSNTDKANKLAEELKLIVEQKTTSNGESVDIQAISVNQAHLEEARSLGTTPGKLNLIKKLKETAVSPDQIDIKEWIKRPVKDIMKATKNNSKNVKKSIISKDNTDSIKDKNLKKSDKDINDIDINASQENASIDITDKSKHTPKDKNKHSNYLSKNKNKVKNKDIKDNNAKNSDINSKDIKSNGTKNIKPTSKKPHKKETKLKGKQSIKPKNRKFK